MLRGLQKKHITQAADFVKTACMDMLFICAILVHFTPNERRVRDLFTLFRRVATYAKGVCDKTVINSNAHIK